MQLCQEGLLPQASGAQQGEPLFKRLKQLWPAKQQPLLHAQASLLQARLSGLLPSTDAAISLVQQAIALLGNQQVHQYGVNHVHFSQMFD